MLLFTDIFRVRVRVRAALRKWSDPHVYRRAADERSIETRTCTGYAETIRASLGLELQLGVELQ